VSRLKRWLLIISVVLVVGFGFVVLRGPKPHIELAAEPIVTIHAFDDQLADINDAMPPTIQNIMDMSVFLQPKITNSLITSWITVAVLGLFAYMVSKRVSLIPSGIQSAVEALMEWFLRLCEGLAGERNGRAFFPIVMSIFIFVLAANWLALLPFFGNVGLFRDPEHETAVVARDVGGVSLIVPEGPVFEPPTELEVHGLAEDASHEERIHAFEEAAAEEGVDLENKNFGVLIPFFRSLNTDVNTPLALAIVSFVFVEYWGIKNLGRGVYLSKFFNFSKLRQGKITEGLIDVFVGFLELLSEFIRIVSFTFRLFGNTTAGEVLLLIAVFLVPFFLQNALAYPLELFFGMIQAFIFATLTLVFAVMAVAHHGPEQEHEHPGEEIGPEHHDTLGLKA
jgi:F-type H+-transporting ATPase subunit a